MGKHKHNEPFYLAEQNSNSRLESQPEAGIRNTWQRSGPNYNTFHAKIMLISADILTFNREVNTTSERLKAMTSVIFQHFSVYEQLKFHALLS